MTLQERARDTAIWTMRVAATFVVFGGFIGGLVIGLGFPIIAVVTHWPPYFDPAWLVQFPMLALIAGAYGTFIGFPASALTALAYLVSPKFMRRRWPLAVFGAAASAAWSVLLVDWLSSSSAALDSYGPMAAIFATCGAVSSLVCVWLLKRWDLHRPA